MTVKGYGRESLLKVFCQYRTKLGVYTRQTGRNLGSHTAWQHKRFHQFTYDMLGIGCRAAITGYEELAAPLVGITHKVESMFDVVTATFELRVTLDKGVKMAEIIIAVHLFIKLI